MSRKNNFSKEDLIKSLEMAREVTDKVYEVQVNALKDKYKLDDVKTDVSAKNDKKEVKVAEKKPESTEDAKKSENVEEPKEETKAEESDKAGDQK